MPKQAKKSRKNAKIRLGLSMDGAMTLRDMLGHILGGYVGTDIFMYANEFKILHDILRSLDRIFPGYEYGTSIEMKHTLKKIEARDRRQDKRKKMG